MKELDQFFGMLREELVPLLKKGYGKQSFDSGRFSHRGFSRREAGRAGEISGRVCGV